MGTVSKAVIAAANGLLGGFHKRILSDWECLWWEADLQFTYRGRQYEYFYHNHNCGWPPGRVTERSVELALADRWLAEHEGAKVIEIGAVTPYYWPRRVARVIDPADPHPLVTVRGSLFDVELTGAAVLSISTFEHIGVAEYGQEFRPGAAVEALRKLFAESDCFLVTVPIGLNAFLDEHLFEGNQSGDVKVNYLARKGNRWFEVDTRTASRLTYGPGDAGPEGWANGIGILER